MGGTDVRCRDDRSQDEVRVVDRQDLDAAVVRRRHPVRRRVPAVRRLPLVAVAGGSRVRQSDDGGDVWRQAVVAAQLDVDRLGLAENRLQLDLARDVVDVLRKDNRGGWEVEHTSAFRNLKFVNISPNINQ